MSLNLNQDQFKDFQKTKWKSWQCPTWMPAFFQGVGLGVVTGCLILVVILPLYLSSIYKATTISTTTMITTAITSTTTPYYSCSNFNITFNWNYPNNDIMSVSPMAFHVCCSWCLSTSTCTAFALTNSSSTCWLKSSTGGGGGAAANVVAATR